MWGARLIIYPGMMPEEDYDLAGFTVGVVDKEKILSNETMIPGDVMIALPSTGVHSNGFSLVRHVFNIDADPAVLHTTPAELGGQTLQEFKDKVITSVSDREVFSKYLIQPVILTFFGRGIQL